jgi:hypothetical protein
MTYTEAGVPVSKRTFDEIENILRSAGYAHVVHGDFISMSGLRLVVDEARSVGDAIKDAIENGIIADRQSSDAVASLAARILGGGNPLDNDQVYAAIRRGIGNAIAATGGVEPNLSDGTLKSELEAVLGQYFRNMLSLAGSVVSQADGPE